MDSSKTLVLKENYTFLVTDRSGDVRGGEQGLYSFDTRYLNRYAWDFGEGFRTVFAECPFPDRAVFRYSRIEGPAQLVGILRELRLTDERLEDGLTVTNTSMKVLPVRLAFELGCDFIDLFEARGFARLERKPDPPVFSEGKAVFRYRDTEGNRIILEAVATGVGRKPRVEGWEWEAELAPGGTMEITVVSRLSRPQESVPAEGYGYRDWEARTGDLYSRLPDGYGRVLRQAVRDLRALLLFTPQGPVPAAGIPWYVAAFGRDSLLTSHMALPHYPAMAEGTLRYLARFQGKTVDVFRAEEPGKIMHEIRFGELARRKLIPHTPYYGTIDATPLYLILFREYLRLHGTPLVAELREHWEAALSWMKDYGDRDGDGFLEFRGIEPGAPSRGLVVQSWKDSEDSMSHADGNLAEGNIAPAEVQGYAYRAALAAADLYEAVGEKDPSEEWLRYAEDLKERFDGAFWVERLGTYAPALDGKKRPLEVKSSNAGQLLWTGIVPPDRAGTLVRTLMGKELLSGWGIRTLGAGEKRYNPLSYHNGSVWPHDTALIARGMADYGYTEEARVLARAVFDLAVTQADCRLPELVGGYEREPDESPVPYPAACRPQAWDAASLLYLADLIREPTAPRGTSRREP